jgi:hypothetical protein
MITQDIRITTFLLLKGALIFALLDGICLPLLNWSIQPIFFKKMKWALIITTGLVWFTIWWLVLTYFWNDVYTFVFPAWSRIFIPLAFGLLNAGVSSGIWFLSQKSANHPVLLFCSLGGIWGMLTHLLAIYRGILTLPPMLQGASPLAAILIAIFEYIFYWCMITSLAAFFIWIRMQLASK